MDKTVFDFRSYKDFLNHVIDERGRGEKSRLALAMKCTIAYVAQVVKGGAQLSLEQADLCNQYLSHGEEAADYFLLLVSHERAGTVSLRRQFEQKIERALKQRALLVSRLKDVRALPDETQIRYYSAWFYSAIHMILTIPELQTREGIAHHLRLPVSQVSEILDFLAKAGLAESRGGRFVTGSTPIHLRADSPWVARHHSNWRLQAIQAADRPKPDHMHYSAVASMSPEDAPKIRKILVDALERIRAVVRESPEKTLFCYNLDLFEV